MLPSNYPNNFGLLLEPKHPIILNWATFGAQAGIFDTERPDF